MSATSILSTDYQLAIPESIRDAQHWKAGQEFVLLPRGLGVLLLPVPTMEELFGIAEGANTKNFRERAD